MPAAAQVVNVQVINVCDDAGQNCALSSPYAGIGYNPAAIQRIFEQAGVTVNLLAPVTYNSTAFLNPAIIDAPAQGYLFGSPTDAAHQLMNLPGHGQNLDRNVLDLWLVNTLPHNPDANGASTAAQPFGIGLTNANGAVVTTGNNGSGYVAGIDNIAHELAHNLGLTHTESAPLAGTTVAAGPAVTQPAAPGTYANAVPVDTSANLLRGSGRLVPRDPCAIATPTCANVTPPSGKDQLLPFQQQQIQTTAKDLFSVGGLTATATLSKGTCTPASLLNCQFSIDLVAPGGSNESLNGFKLRYLNDVAGETGYAFTENLAACNLQLTGYENLPGGGQDQIFSLDDGCLTPAKPGGSGGGIILANFTPGQFVPFSFEFDFSSGLTSRAAFNSSGIADSTTPFYLSRTDVPPNSVGLDLPTDPTLFNAAFAFELEGGTPLDVPEPAATVLFAAAVAIAIMVANPWSRRRASPAHARKPTPRVVRA